MNSENSHKNKSPRTECNRKINANEAFTNNSLLESRESSSNMEVKEKDINMGEFLNLMKVSSHVNDMITINNTSIKSIEELTEESIAKQNDFDFGEIVENRLVNELLDCKNDTPAQSMKAERVESENPCSSSACTEFNLSQRRSTIGLTIGSFSRRTSKKTEDSTIRTDNIHPKLYEKLDYVINEGMVDSVLSFICPIPVPATFPSQIKTRPKEIIPPKATVSVGVYGNEETSVNLQKAQGDNNKTTESTLDIMPREKKKNYNSRIICKQTLTRKEKREKEPEITIHVCDEVKNTTRDFVCSQRLLVNKMGYFADVTAGQKLDEMDISVHCDIQIFEWLMKWIKLSDLSESSKNVKSIFDTINATPQLDASNVIPILVSANFLQMEPLMLECLSFCHSQLNDVVRSPTNVSCLNDLIITRLAAMFTNLELDMVRDKKDRLVPRLWAKLIQSLCEPEPEALRGHFYSLSGLFRCIKCGDCLTNTFKPYVNCVSSNMRLNRWGQLVNFHVRDNLWNMNTYIAQLFKDLKTWRRVYWKLWSHGHFLYCCVCETHFPVYQMTWCRFHPMSPNFLGPFKADCVAGPTGRYPCCGQQAFRFETLPGSNGCQFREHSVLVETDRERQILQIVQIVSDDIVICEHAPKVLQEVFARSDVKSFWNGLSLIPQLCRPGLLPMLNIDESSSRHHRDITSIFESSSDTDTSDIVENRKIFNSVLSEDASCHDFYSSSDGCESEQSDFKVSQNKKQKKRKQSDNPGRYWCGELSARSNQDHQREYEEKIMKQVIALVNKKSGSEQSLAAQNVAPSGGSYVRLETEWRDQLKHRNCPSNSNSTTGLGRPKNK